MTEASFKVYILLVEWCRILIDRFKLRPSNLLVRESAGFFAGQERGLYGETNDVNVRCVSKGL